MRITKRQLRRIIREAYYDEDGNYVTNDGKVIPAAEITDELETARFRSKNKAEDAAIDMVFGDTPNQRLHGALPWEIRIISLNGEYALWAMESNGDIYKGEGTEIAAVPRGGSIRYGRRI